jgi:hypothetical protein
MTSTSNAPASRLARLILLLGVIPLAVSCSDDGDAAPPSTTERATSPTVATTSTAHDESAQTEADVIEAYEAASEAFLDAAAIPDPDFPALLNTHVDPMLNQRRGVLTQLKFDGRVIRLPENPVHSIEAESFELRDPNTAVLEVCIVDDGERYDAATGELLTDGQPGTSRFEAALQRVDGRWVLAEQLLQEEWPGVSGCAVD